MVMVSLMLNWASVVAFLNKPNNPNTTLLQSVLTTVAKGKNSTKCFMEILNLFPLWLSFLLAILQLVCSVIIKPQSLQG